MSNKIRTIFIIIMLLFVSSIPVASATENNLTEPFFKVLIGELNGKQVCNVYGTDISMTIENINNKLDFPGHQAINITKNEIVAIKSSGNTKQLFILNASGEITYKKSIRNYVFINKDTLLMYIGTIGSYKLGKMVLLNKDNESWKEDKHEYYVPPVHTFSRGRFLEPLGNYLISSLGNKIYFYTDFMWVDNYNNCVGHLSEYEYCPDKWSKGLSTGSKYHVSSKVTETTYYLEPLREKFTTDVYNIHTDNEKLYFQRFSSNSLYDGSEKMILAEIDGAAIVNDGMILYKNKENLILAAVDDPAKILKQAKADYSIVSYHAGLYVDVVRIKKGKNLIYIPYNELIKEFEVNPVTE